MRFIAIVVMSLLLGSGASASVTVAVEQETKLYAEEVAPTGLVKAGEQVEILGEQDGWYKVRYRTPSGDSQEGLAAAGAFARTGDVAKTMRHTSVYPLSRPVLATVPSGGEVEVIKPVEGGYLVRFAPADARPISGIAL